jgi:glycosyltransferase involved in cell wall biosynthesis
MQDYTNYHIVYVDDASNDNIQTEITQYLNRNLIPE